MEEDISYCDVVHEISHSQFSFYSPDEIRRISVKQITSPVTFNALKQPVSGYI